jgi:hypothetical protein
MTSAEAHIAQLVESSHSHLMDLIVRVEGTMGALRDELRETRAENHLDHAEVKSLVGGLAARVTDLESADRDDETVTRERRRFRNQILAVVLGANALAATVTAIVAVIIG